MGQRSTILLPKLLWWFLLRVAFDVGFVGCGSNHYRKRTNKQKNKKLLQNANVGCRKVRCSARWSAKGEVQCRKNSRARNEPQHAQVPTARSGFLTWRGEGGKLSGHIWLTLCPGLTRSAPRRGAADFRSKNRPWGPKGQLILPSGPIFEGSKNRLFLLPSWDAKKSEKRQFGAKTRAPQGCQTAEPTPGGCPGKFGGSLLVCFSILTVAVSQKTWTEKHRWFKTDDIRQTERKNNG